MTAVNAHLMFIDGQTMKVRVADPPPATFVMTTPPMANRVLVLRRYSRNGAIYVERDRRKSVMPVEQDRRRRRAES
jgi:hypothetical protein